MENQKDIVRAGYNKCAQTYLDSRELFMSQKYLEEVVLRLPRQAKILDIGCGSGVPVDKFLLEHGFQVTGVDISEEQIKLAKTYLPQGSFSVQDMCQIDFPEGSFDAIVSFYAIFHIPRQEHLSLFKKLYRLIKPEGYLLITMGSSEWEGIEDDFYGVRMFWSHYGREMNLELVKQAGFRVVNEEIDTSGGERHQVIFAKKQNGS